MTRLSEPVPLEGLVATWRARADELRPYATGAAVAFERAADELEHALGALAMQALTLKHAAAESGYSADHLGRLIAEGQIPNAGRPHAPRILRRDLPRKATGLPAPSSPVTLVGVTPRQIARAVVNSTPGATR